MSFLFAAQLGRLGTVGRIAARQFLIIRCLWNDFLFQNEIAEGGFASVLPQVRNKTRQFAQAQRGTVTNFDLFDAWPFLLARRRAAMPFSLSGFVEPIPTPHETPQQDNATFPIDSRLRGRAGPACAGGNVRHDTSAPA